jgi:hypothetical protein
MILRRLRVGRLVTTAALLGSVFITVPAASEEDLWQDFRPLVGTWEGEGSGFGIISDVTHEWGFVIDNKFLRLRTRSVPRDAEKSAEVHEDVGFLSRDTDQGIFVFRQFLSEGFVNTFAVTAERGEKPGLVFEYHEVESGGGLRARMYLEFISDSEYEMTLELAAPEKEFAPCQHMRMKRAK